MSFGGIFDSGGGARVVVDIPYGGAAMAGGGGAIPSLPKYMFSSPALSLGLMNMDGKGEVVNKNRLVGGAGEFDSSTGRNSKEDGCESRSGSDNVEGGSGDDLDPDLNRPSKKKKYHRHTPQQIQELEALFKECPHPDEKQRLELSRRLNLETRQVKFWFQNRRTQMKTQLERHENALLRQENEKLRVENMSIREAIRNPICTGCGSPAILGEVSLEEQHLRLDNARLKDELDRVCALAAKFLGRPVSSLPGQLPSIDMGFASALNGSLTSTTTATTLSPYMVDFVVPPQNSTVERSLYLELALAAMDELVKMVQLDEPLWVGGGTKESLNYDEYLRVFPRCIGPKPGGFVSEATRETCTVMAGSLALVDTFMDPNRWREMFPCIVARASTVDVISGGMGGSRNGALQLMQAELQALSPLVPIRVVNFLRFCKQHAEGVWAVVDVSVDVIREENSSHAHSPYLTCSNSSSRRLPSGCILQDLPNGCSKVTWVEHAEYDEAAVHQLYRPSLRSGMAFGALRWVAALHRQCDCLAILMSPAVRSRDLSVPITASGRRSMLKLAQRMTDNFCAGVCASSVHKWNKLNVGSVDEGVRVMTRKSVDDPGEPSGVVLSAATSVWLPVPPHRLFDFLRDERLRSEWDILSNGGPMQEMAHIPKGHDSGNCVSLLRASAMSANQTNMLILQETRTDASGSLVVYAPVDIPAMQVVMSGGDSAYVALLPSGFAVTPDGPQTVGGGDDISPASAGVNNRAGGGGSLLTVAFQILVNSLPTAKLTVESVETVNNLISCTVQKIKAALHCGGGSSGNNNNN